MQLILMQTPSIAWSFYKENIPPTIAFNSSSPLFLNQNTNPAVNVTFTDQSTFGLNSSYYQLEDWTGNVIISWTSLFTNLNQQNQSEVVQISNSTYSPLSQGLYTIYFNVTDNVGNILQGTDASWSFYKDLTAPTVVINTKTEHITMFPFS